MWDNKLLIYDITSTARKNCFYWVYLFRFLQSPVTNPRSLLRAGELVADFKLLFQSRWDKELSSQIKFVDPKNTDFYIKFNLA
jgi:hypothetical protein